MHPTRFYSAPVFDVATRAVEIIVSMPPLIFASAVLAVERCTPRSWCTTRSVVIIGVSVGRGLVFAKVVMPTVGEMLVGELSILSTIVTPPTLDN